MSVRDMPTLGSLRDRIELFSNSQSANGSGGLTDNFVSLGLVWARVRSTQGALTSDLDGRSSKTSHGVVMRYRQDLKPGDRVQYRGQNLEIVSAEDLNGRRAYLSCRCIEIDQTG